MYSFSDNEQKRTVEQFNKLSREYTKLYNELLLISNAPRPAFVPPPPITCTSTRIGDTSHDVLLLIFSLWGVQHPGGSKDYVLRSFWKRVIVFSSRFFSCRARPS
jgi:hypothetical protein